MRAAVYARVSTVDQEPENQLQEVRRYIQARDWTVGEYVDRGVSGVKDRRPALDDLVRDARRRRFDVLVCWRLDRLGRNLKHLITLLDEQQALWIAFVSLAEGIDATTPAGKLQMHILGAIAEFERERIRERVCWPGCSGPERKASDWVDRKSGRQSSGSSTRWTARAYRGRATRRVAVDDQTVAPTGGSACWFLEACRLRNIRRRSRRGCALGSAVDQVGSPSVHSLRLHQRDDMRDRRA